MRAIPCPADPEGVHRSLTAREMGGGVSIEDCDACPYTKLYRRLPMPTFNRGVPLRRIPDYEKGVLEPQTPRMDDLSRRG